MGAGICWAKLIGFIFFPPTGDLAVISCSYLVLNEEENIIQQKGHLVGDFSQS